MRKTKSSTALMLCMVLMMTGTIAYANSEDVKFASITYKIRYTSGETDIETRYVTRPPCPEDDSKDKKIIEGELESPYEQKATITIKINGVTLQTDVAPYIKDDRIMVPFRHCFEGIGAQEVGYDFSNPDQKLVWAKKDGVRVDMQIGKTTVYREGKTIAMDVAPEIVNGRTFIPVEYAAEILGAIIADWDASTRTVIIITDDHSP